LPRKTSAAIELREDAKKPSEKILPCKDIAPTGLLIVSELEIDSSFFLFVCAGDRATNGSDVSDPKKKRKREASMVISSFADFSHSDKKKLAKKISRGEVLNEKENKIISDF
jgi:hypothetical protein